MAVVTLFGMPPHFTYVRLNPLRHECVTVYTNTMYGHHKGRKMSIIGILLPVL